MVFKLNLLRVGLSRENVFFTRFQQSSAEMMSRHPGIPSIEVFFSVLHEKSAQIAKLLQSQDQMLGAADNPNRQTSKPALSGIVHQLIESRPQCFDQR